MSEYIIPVEMEVDEGQTAFNMEVSEEIDVTVVQGTDVSDTTAVEADVVSGKKFHKANGSLATGTLVLPPDPVLDDSIYLLRALPYTSYLKQLQKIIGGSVAWNNIIASTYTTKTYEGITTTGANGTFTITNNSRTAKYNTGSTQNRVTSTITGLIKSGHKYIVYGESTSDLTGVCVAIGSSTVGIPINSIFVPSSSANYLTLRVTKDYDFVTNHPVGDVCTFTMNVTDLTQAFGLTIADYIYSLETANAGTGVARFKALFSKSVYATDMGSLLSVKPSASKAISPDGNSYALYPFDSTIELRGLLKLDANNNLYYDGDEYTADGTVKRKYEYRAYESGDESLADAITDGTHTVVKLTTPTTESSTPYIEHQACFPNGTEQFVDGRTVEMPVEAVAVYVL